MVFVVVAVAVGSRRRPRCPAVAEQAAPAAEAQALSTLAGDIVRRTPGRSAARAVAGVFGKTPSHWSNALDQRSPWVVVDLVGGAGTTLWLQRTPTPQCPSTTDALCLDCAVALLDAEDRRVLDAFAAQAVALLDRDRLRGQPQEAAPLARSTRSATALLAAVSHDVRTPLAAIKAGVSSSAQSRCRMDADEQPELLAAVEESPPTGSTRC